MKKRLTLFFITFLFAGLCALPAFAVSQARSVNATTTAETVSLVCEYCGQSDMICVDEYYASWYTVNFIPCQGRDPRYNDSVENRTHVEIYQCQSCKFGTSVVSTEEQISHKHPAMPTTFPDSDISFAPLPLAAGAFLILAAFSAKTEKIRDGVLFSFTTLW